MKILYAIQATGNGHISRAIQLMPYLQKHGVVDVFLSGSNSCLQGRLPVKFRSKGISLFYDNLGALDVKKIISLNQWSNAWKEAKCLPVEKYDLVINDFEPITSRACYLKGKHSVQLSHQASFRSKSAPRPVHKSILGELILKYYSTSSEYIGFHFKSYEDFILPPVIKQKIMYASPVDKGHITIYLAGYHQDFFKKKLTKFRDIQFHVFIAGLEEKQVYRNITFFPIGDEMFSQSMIECHGMITGGGFETPSEALYLNKKLLVIPLKNHYEQYCNAAALEAMGILSVTTGEPDHWIGQIVPWLDRPGKVHQIVPNDINETISKVIAKAVPGPYDAPPLLAWHLQANDIQPGLV